MARTTIDTWRADFSRISPLFDPLRDCGEIFSKHDHWPTLEHLTAELDNRKIQSYHGKKIKTVAQADKTDCFDDSYEPRIYLKGELQTRLENWHDFFNALAWMRFPTIKAQLNALHYHSALNRDAKTNRSALENAITLFDECGAIVVSSDETLLQLIRDHQWKTLFWNRRKEIQKNLRCFVFGHAMYEKALQPYIGMTTNTLLMIQPEAFFSAPFDDQLKQLDQQVARLWQENKIPNSQALNPFPVLGMPGWHDDNQVESFYDNRQYFRSKRMA